MLIRKRLFKVKFIRDHPMKLICLLAPICNRGYLGLCLEGGTTQI